MRKKGRPGEYTRCRIHGGTSTGARTPEGIERIRQASLKHGNATKEAFAARRAHKQQKKLRKFKSFLLDMKIKALKRELGAMTHAQREKLKRELACE
jgi:hypothetical protein